MVAIQIGTSFIHTGLVMECNAISIHVTMQCRSLCAYEFMRPVNRQLGHSQSPFIRL